MYSDISQNQSEIRSPVSRPIRQQADASTARLCQLETRSYGNDHRCLHHELGSDQGLRQPPMEPHGKGTCTNSQTTSKACISGTNMERPGLVPSTTGHASGHTTTNPPEGGSDPTHTPREPPRGNPPAKLCELSPAVIQRLSSFGVSYKAPPGIMEAKILKIL